MLDLEILREEYEVLYGGHVCPILSLSESRNNNGRLYATFRHPSYGSYDAYFDRKTLIAEGHEQENNPIRIRKRARSVIRDVWFIRIGHDIWAKDDWIDTEKFTEIETAKARLEVVKTNLTSSESPFKARLRKDTEMAEVYDFDQWAQYRFESGEWGKLPWADEPWVKPELETLHFAHFAVDESNQVAFWETTARAQSDQVSLMTGGRYLERFYGDVLTPTEIENWVHKLDPPGELVFSGSDPEAIYEAYDATGASGLHSCMAYRDNQSCHDGVRWQSNGKSPVRVYGAGDLEVATLVRNGRRVARALVWRERKAVGRIYGDVGRMKTALRAEGYDHDGDWVKNDMHTIPKGLLSGARLLKIPVEGCEGNFAMPYIDFSYGVVDDGEFFLLDKHTPLRCHRTDGLMKNPPDDNYFVCERCGDSEDADEVYHVGTETWCYGCYEDHAWSCDRCNELVSRLNTLDVGGDQWCTSCVSDHSSVCDACNTRVADGHTNTVHNHAGIQTGCVCDDCVPDEDHSDYVMINGRVYDAMTLVRENA